MKFTGEEARNIIYHENTDWREVAKTQTIMGKSRWSICYAAVFEHAPTGTFYRFCWSIGATEHQDESPYEYDVEYEPQEVVKQEKMMEVWEPIT